MSAGRIFCGEVSILFFVVYNGGRSRGGGLLKMAGIGVISCIGNNQFNPNGELTREQSIMTAYRLFETMQ